MNGVLGLEVQYFPMRQLDISSFFFGTVFLLRIALYYISMGGRMFTFFFASNVGFTNGNKAVFPSQSE